MFAWLELILLGLIWGASFFSIRIALNEIPFLTSVLHRTMWAMLFLWAVILIMKLQIPLNPQIWFSFLIMGLLNNAIPFSLMAWAQLHVETGLISILNSSTAVFSVITAALFFADERLTIHKTVGVLMGFTGVIFAIGIENIQQLNLKSLAQIAIIVGTLFYALASVWGRIKLVGLSPQVSAAGMLTMSTVFIFPVVIIIDGPIQFVLMPTTWLAIGYYSIIATAVAYLLYFRILAKAGSSNVMLVTLMIPPVAILLGSIFLVEKLPATAFFGFALLAIGLIILDKRIINKVLFQKQ
ncbi:MAG: DMT family transporter [Aestuariivita sp.]|nr:DMT family transporter [Aestuariivita sp.]